MQDSSFSYHSYSNRNGVKNEEDIAVNSHDVSPQFKSKLTKLRGFFSRLDEPAAHFSDYDSDKFPFFPHLPTMFGNNKNLKKKLDFPSKYKHD